MGDCIWGEGDDRVCVGEEMNVGVLWRSFELNPEEPIALQHPLPHSHTHFLLSVSRHRHTPLTSTNPRTVPVPSKSSKLIDLMPEG